LRSRSWWRRAKAPGCYAWQVDGLTFSEIIVVHAAWFQVGRAAPPASIQR
jgi:hypothetical protein